MQEQDHLAVTAPVEVVKAHPAQAEAVGILRQSHVVERQPGELGSQSQVLELVGGGLVHESELYAPPVSWEPSSRSCAAARSSRGRWAGRNASSGSAPPAASTVRDRIDRLFDAGHVPRDGRARRARQLRGRRADRLPSRQRGGRAGADRRPACRRAGRRLHRSRRRRRCRDRGEDGLRGAARQRVPHAARAPGRRHRRRRQRQVAGDDGLHVRAVHPRLGGGGREPLDRAGGRRGAGAGGRPGRRARGCLALLGDRAGNAQLFVAGPPVVAAAMGESPDKEQLGGARTQTRAGAVDNEARRRGRRARADQALPLVPSVERLGGAARSRPAAIRATGASRSCSRSCRATGASPTRRERSSRRCSTAIRSSSSAPSTDVPCAPPSRASTGGPSGCSPPIRTTTRVA